MTIIEKQKRLLRLERRAALIELVGMGVMVLSFVEAILLYVKAEFPQGNMSMLVGLAANVLFEKMSFTAQKECWRLERELTTDYQKMEDHYEG